MCFNNYVKNLPWTLKCLTFGSRFEQDVSMLPPVLEELHFGYKFNRKIPVLNKLRKLTIPLNYKYPIPSRVNVRYN